MTLDEIKDLIAALPGSTAVVLNINVTLDAPDPPDIVPLDPGEDEPEFAAAVVVADKTLMRFASSVNAKGRPVMTIYPADNAPAAQRVKRLYGETLLVDPGAITADGGGQFYRLVDQAPDGRTPLYVVKADVDLDE